MIATTERAEDMESSERPRGRSHTLKALISLIALLGLPGLASPQPAAKPATPSGESYHRPSPVVTLTLADPSPVIGVTGETELRIEVTDAPSDPMPIPRVLCSSGQIEDLGREGSASFTARYILPAGRFPQTAIIVAEFTDHDQHLRGMSSVRLRAATTPALLTNPGAQVTLRVGDREFGPQTAPSDGVVRIPVVVPPGVEFATARSVNQHGKSTEQMLDLHVPYSQRVLFAAPTLMVAGSVAEVAVYAVDPSGRPAHGADLTLQAAGAKVNPLGSGVPGEARFLVRAPSILREKSLRMEAQLKGQSTTRTATRVALVPGPATGLTLEPEAPYLERAPGASLRVFLGAEDAFGNPVDAGRADVLVDGQFAPVTADADGEPMVVVRTPANTPSKKDVVVESVLDAGYDLRRIPIGVRLRPPRAEIPLANPSPRYTLTPRLGGLWNFGHAAGATLFVDALAFRSVHHPDFGVGLSVGLVETGFAAESAGGISKVALSALPVLFRIHYRAAMGRTFLGLAASAGFAMAWSRTRSYDTTIVGRSFGAAGDATLETGVRLRHGHLVASLRYLAVYLNTFSSGDRIEGNTAGVVLDAGYRIGF